MPALRVHQHQVLLLQQLQPHPAPPLLQDLPTLLDTWRRAEERPRGRRLQEEQKEQQRRKQQVKVSGEQLGPANWFGRFIRSSDSFKQFFRNC